ncbi:centromere protein P-like [Lissotriton helveticus]
MLRQYEDEIRSLEDEIHQLTEKFRSQEKFTHHEGEHLPMTPLKTNQNAADLEGELQNATDLEGELEVLELELAYLKKLTGTEFTEYSRKSAERNDSQTLHKYTLAGNCGCLSFTLEFELLCNLQNDTTAVVTDLNILILDSEGDSELRTFVSAIEEKTNLLLFFRAFSAFSECCMRRKNTFRRFKERYPVLNRLPEGSSADHMVVTNPQLLGSELIIVWQIYVGEEGTVTPVLDLLTKIPEQALALDQKKVVERAPAAFRTLLKVYRIDTAIDKLIQAFAMLE